MLMRQSHWMSDSEQFGVPEFWCEAKSGFDDCDGYALLKRELLKEQGFDEKKFIWLLAG